MSGGGTEKRSQILPTIDLGSSGFIAPTYDFTANVPTPKQIGVSRGNSVGSVINAVRGVAYYGDVIGFGESANPLTRGMNFYPLGINYFMNTGLTCTNGQKMAAYVEGIPNGDALGQTVKNAMAEMGLPGLRGLAPGMLEDVQDALNPKPILQAAFGKPYPVCEKVTRPVGDAIGQTTDPKTGDVWVEGPVDRSSGRPMQTRWIQKVDRKGNPIYASREEAEATPKVEGFSDSKQVLQTLFVAGLLFTVAYLVVDKRK